MLKIDWSRVEFFKPSEFSAPDKMSAELIYSLDLLRKKVGRPFIVHSSYREGDTGTHGQGLAVDGHFVGLGLIDQFLAAEKSLLFGGIGLYPYWNNKGLHLDVKPITQQNGSRRWGRNAAGIYVAIDEKFIRECL